jgi:integrase
MFFVGQDVGQQESPDMPKAIAEKSARAVEALKKPGRYAVGPTGLYLTIRENGARVWAFLYSIAGKRREMHIGSAEASGLSLKAAREEVKALRTALASGIDPVVAREASRLRASEIPSFAKMAEEVVSSLETGFRNAKHRQQWRNTLTTYCKGFARKPVDQVSVEDVLSALKRIWQAKPETASRVRGRIEKVLDAAKAKGHRTGENPAAWRGHLALLLPKRQPETRGHHKAMPYADVPAFLKVLEGKTSSGALALRFTILTAARTSEVLGARWSEFDLAARVWTVPAARMKAKRQHRIPLTDAALAVLETAKAGRTDSSSGTYVFPGIKEGRPLSSMTMDKVLRSEKLDVTVHGFRSSFRDWTGEETPFPREIAEAALAHVIGDKAEQAYRRGDALEKRRALMSAWADYLKGSAPDNVVPMRGLSAA